MDETKRVVHLVDDDEAIRRSASFMLRTSGLTVKTYASGQEILSCSDGLTPGCILLDMRMPVMDGLDVQRTLRERGIMLPIIVMTGHGDIGSAVRAMKDGAIDFIEKPFEKAVALAALEDGFARLELAGNSRVCAEEADAKLQCLTPRELDVIKGLVRGYPNKTIAFDLGISPRTVEIHRAHVMSKLGAANLSDALKIAFAAGLGNAN